MTAALWGCQTRQGPPAPVTFAYGGGQTAPVINKDSPSPTSPSPVAGSSGAAPLQKETLRDSGPVVTGMPDHKKHGASSWGKTNQTVEPDTRQWAGKAVQDKTAFRPLKKPKPTTLGKRDQRDQDKAGAEANLYDPSEPLSDVQRPRAVPVGVLSKKQREKTDVKDTAHGQPQVVTDAPSPQKKTDPASFIWPLSERGTVVLPYGKTVGGLQNDGINIAAPQGTPIRAAASGRVVYAGNEMQGFGNLILIRHGGGFTTFYGHCATMAVERGRHVAQGDVIGTVGATGNVKKPQLHFELRKKTALVNPTDYLKP